MLANVAGVGGEEHAHRKRGAASLKLARYCRSQDPQRPGATDSDRTREATIGPGAVRVRFAGSSALPPDRRLAQDGDYLGDHLGATGLVDRMVHHSHVIVINGPSYRDWEHQQDAGTIRPAAPPMPETATAAPQPAARATSGGARRRGK